MLAGKWQDHEGKTEFKACPEGWMQNSTEAIECGECSLGQYQGEGDRAYCDCIPVVLRVPQDQ